MAAFNFLRQLLYKNPMQCSRCGGLVPSGARFCSHCGNAIQIAGSYSGGLPIGSRDYLAKTHRFIVFGAVIAFFISTSFLHLTAGLIFGLALVAGCFFWSSRRIAYRSKLWFCGVAVALVVTAQIAEPYVEKNNEVQRRTQDVRDKEERAHRASQAQQIEAAHFASMSSSEHLNAAKQLLVTNATDADAAFGFRHLDALNHSDRAAGTKLKRSFLLLRKQQQQRASLEVAQRERDEAKIGEAARMVMAKSFENRLLDQGMNVDVTAEGPKHTTMKVKYVLANKVLVHQLGKNSEIFDSLRKQGFKKLIVTDGYDESWSWKI